MPKRERFYTGLMPILRYQAAQGENQKHKNKTSPCPLTDSAISTNTNHHKYFGDFFRHSIKTYSFNRCIYNTCCP